MPSGTITFNKSSLTSNKGYVLGKIDYEYTQSTSDNTSTITFKVYVKKDIEGSYVTQSTNGVFKYSLNINGETITGEKNLQIMSTYLQIGSFTRTISHNDNGTKSVAINGDVWLRSNSSSVYYNRKSHVDTSLTLDMIPRASSISSAAGVTLGNKCNVKWTPKASEFAYKLKFTCGNVSYTTGYITPKTTSSYTYNAYTMTIETWAKALPTSYSGTCNVTLYTYLNTSSSNSIGSQSSSFTITIPNTIKPRLYNFTTTLVDGWQGYYVQGKSKCKLSAQFEAGEGSSIVSCSITGTGLSKTGTGTSLSAETSVLTKSGTMTYTATVRDGRTSISTPKSIDVYPYAAPVLSTFTAARTTTSGQVKITHKASCSSINSTNNITKIQIYQKLSTESIWEEVTIPNGINPAIDTIYLNGYDTTLSYDFRAVVFDSLGSSSIYLEATVPSEFRIFNINRDKTGLAIGKMSEDDTFDCNLIAKFSKDIQFGIGNPAQLRLDQNSHGTNIAYIMTGQHTPAGAEAGLAIHNESVYVPNESNDGVVNLGSSGRKWNQLYAANSTISTSDKAVKTNISNMSDVQEQLFNKLNPVTFKFINGTSNRTHYGFISQDIEDSLNELNLTGKDFAGFCKDLRVDDSGNAILDANNNKIYDYALRYSEFIALNTYMIQKLQAENHELKIELEKLKEMIVGTSSNNME